MHAGARAEPILAAWGITTNSTPVLAGLAPGGTESTDAWADFLSELVGRGLRPPLLIISDAAPGLLSACEQVFGRSLRQKCLIHRARNVLAKVPAEAQTELKNAYWQPARRPDRRPPRRPPHGHALRPRPHHPRPTPQLHPRRLHGLGNLSPTWGQPRGTSRASPLNAEMYSLAFTAL